MHAHSRMTHAALATIVLPALACPALAQAIDANNRFAWGENIGFLNFADAGDPPGSQAVYANSAFLEGFVWGENIGWINLGDGSGPYTNNDHTDFGVNRNTITGQLFGYAWGENIGWVNFAGGAFASPPNPARIEDGRLRGYAWGENIGWINLDDPNVFVALACPADLAPPFGTINIFDIQAFIQLYNSQDPAADLAVPFGIFNIFDIQQYINLYNQGCP